MIVIRGELELDPADRAAFVAAVAPLTAATVAEPGCVEYRFWQDLERPERFHVFEEWEDDASLTAHNSGPDLATYREAVAGLGIRGTSIVRYDVADRTVLR